MNLMRRWLMWVLTAPALLAAAAVLMPADTLVARAAQEDPVVSEACRTLGSPTGGEDELVPSVTADPEAGVVDEHGGEDQMFTGQPAAHIETDEPTAADTCAEPPAPVTDIDSLIDEENDGTTRGGSGTLETPFNFRVTKVTPTQITFAWQNVATATNTSGGQRENWLYYRRAAGATTSDFKAQKVSGATSGFTLTSSGGRWQVYIRVCLSTECSNPSSIISVVHAPEGTRLGLVSYSHQGCLSPAIIYYAPAGTALTFEAACPLADRRFASWISGPCEQRTVAVCTLTVSGTAQLGVVAQFATALPPGGPQGGKPDVVIVAIGDGFASGEGAPDRPRQGNTPAVWDGHGDRPVPPGDENRRCHRSRNAAPAQAAALYAAANPQLNVVFMNFACTGASIEAGLIGPYDPRERAADPRNPLPPQLQQAAAAVRAAGFSRIDKLIISAGLLDLPYSKFLFACLDKANSQGCHITPYKPIYDAQYLSTPGVLPEIYGHFAGSAAAGTDGLYGRLYQQVQTMGMPVVKVHALEYPQPWIQPALSAGSPGRMCGTPAHVADGGDLSDSLINHEALVLFKVWNQLNQSIRGQAASNKPLNGGWAVAKSLRMEWTDADFVAAGYCTGTKRLFNTGRDAEEKIGVWDAAPVAGYSLGFLHPNTAGHKTFGNRIFQAIKEQ